MYMEQLIDYTAQSDTRQASQAQQALQERAAALPRQQRELYDMPLTDAERDSYLGFVGLAATTFIPGTTHEQGVACQVMHEYDNTSTLDMIAGLAIAGCQTQFDKVKALLGRIPIVRSYVYTPRRAARGRHALQGI